eukprot:gene11876-14028_t
MEFLKEDLEGLSATAIQEVNKKGKLRDAFFCVLARLHFNNYEGAYEILLGKGGSHLLTTSMQLRESFWDTLAAARGVTIENIDTVAHYVCSSDFLVETAATFVDPHLAEKNGESEDQAEQPQ